LPGRFGRLGPAVFLVLDPNYEVCDGGADPLDDVFLAAAMT
jgi:hypothetical protein